jgi:hypothetical protein
MSGALRRAMRGSLSSHRHGPPTEFLTVPSEQDILDINFVAGGRMIRMSDIATVLARIQVNLPLGIKPL